MVVCERHEASVGTGLQSGSELNLKRCGGVIAAGGEE